MESILEYIRRKLKKNMLILKSKSILDLKEQFYGITNGFQLHRRSRLFRHMTSIAYLKDSMLIKSYWDQTFLNLMGSLG